MLSDKQKQGIHRATQNAYNQYAQGQPHNAAERTPLTDCLKYFRALGLSDEQIRVAITPALFNMVRAGKKE